MAFVLWALGALTCASSHDVLLESPFDRVAPSGFEFSCDVDEAERSRLAREFAAASPREGRTVLDGRLLELQQDGLWHAVEPPGVGKLCEERRRQWEAAAVPRFRSEFYRENAAGLAKEELAWAALLWGTFYVGTWIAKGFQS